jgi:hypothetical protein
MANESLEDDRLVDRWAIRERLNLTPDRFVGSRHRLPGVRAHQAVAPRIRYWVDVDTRLSPAPDTR